jgi:hypothetical protein
MSGAGALHGLLAEFMRPDDLLAATRRAYTAGYRRMDAYTPFPVEELAEALGSRRTWVPAIVLAGGIAGGAGGFAMQYYATVIDYPLNVGGRPLNSWPAYIPITFELTILAAAVAALLGMLALNRLPQPYHPVFNVPEFARASQDRFFLCIEATDPLFDRAGTAHFLDSLGAREVRDVAG